MQVRKQQLELDMEQQTGSKQEKEYVKYVYCHPAYLTYMHHEYIMRNAGLEKTQAGIKFAGRNINSLRYSDDTTPMAESEEEIKSHRSNCWVCRVLPSSSVEGFPWWTSPLQGKDFLQVCEYLRQQSHVMPLLQLMTSTNPKMDWCNTLHFNYGHDVTFNDESECCVFAVCSLHL